MRLYLRTLCQIEALRIPLLCLQIQYGTKLSVLRHDESVCIRKLLTVRYGIGVRRFNRQSAISGKNGIAS